MKTIGLSILILFGVLALASQAPFAARSGSDGAPMAYDPEVWVRYLPSDFRTPISLVVTAGPGDDYVVLATNEHADNVAIKFFSGQIFRWNSNERPPAFLNGPARNPPEDFFPRNDKIELNLNGLRFCCDAADGKVPFGKTALEFRKNYRGISVPDTCKDPASDWESVISGDRKIDLVLIYKYDQKTSVTVRDSCYFSDDSGVDPFPPPYDILQIFSPRLTGFELPDGTILIFSARDSFAYMPAVFRVKKDLSSPAIDQKNLFYYRNAM